MKAIAPILIGLLLAGMLSGCQTGKNADDGIDYATQNPDAHPIQNQNANPAVLASKMISY